MREWLWSRIPKCSRKTAFWRLRKVLLQKNRPDLSGNIVVAVFGFIRCRLRFFDTLVHDAGIDTISMPQIPALRLSAIYSFAVSYSVSYPVMLTAKL